MNARFLECCPFCGGNVLDSKVDDHPHGFRASICCDHCGAQGGRMKWPRKMIADAFESARERFENQLEEILRNDARD